MTADIIVEAAFCALWAVFLILTGITIAVNHKDTKKKTAELHMVAYATYQLSLQVEKLTNSKKEDTKNEETERTE